MPKLPERKVGIVACSGEELAEGTVTRLAALKVLHETRPGKTVTICLPLFLAGGEGDRAFARFHPTITVDGCELRCAARGTELYSGKPTASIVVCELAAEHALEKIEGRRQLNAAGKKAVDLVANRVADLVDKILGTPSLSILNPQVPAPQPEATKPVSCSCGSGLPVKKLNINGQSVEVLGLPLIFEKFRKLGRSPDAAGEDLYEAIKVYNCVLPKDEKNYREAILREYAAFCKEASQ